MGHIQHLVKNKYCARCGVLVLAYGSQKYCGLVRTKTGCAYLVRKERDNKRSMRYYREHKEQIRVRRRTYHQIYAERNREKLSVYAKQYYLDNRDEILRRTEQWRKHNAKYYNFLTRRYVLRKQVATGDHSYREWLTVKSLYGAMCVGCGVAESETVKLTEDHKIPISKGGPNSIDNIQPLCGSCNSSKNAKVMFAVCSILSRKIYLVSNQ